MWSLEDPIISTHHQNHLEGNQMSEPGIDKMASTSAEGVGVGAIRTGAVIGEGRFTVGNQIGSGGFGQVFTAFDKENDGQLVAIKTLSYERFSHLKAYHPGNLATEFQTEYYALLHMKDDPGFPRVYELSRFEGEPFMAMELLGKPLSVLFKEYNCYFSMKTVLILMDQLLTRLEAIHDKGMIHGDLKPENILLGSGANSERIYLIDFGLTTMYKNLLTGKHIAIKDKTQGAGTPRFMSTHAHAHIQQSRRDDFESLAYVLAYLLKRGKLPWNDLVGKRKRKQIGQMKSTMTGAELFEGQLKEFADFLDEVKSLEYTQCPDYSKYRIIFRELGALFGVKYYENGKGLLDL